MKEGLKAPLPYPHTDSHKIGNLTTHEILFTAHVTGKPYAGSWGNPGSCFPGQWWQVLLVDPALDPSLHQTCSNLFIHVDVKLARPIAAGLKGNLKNQWKLKSYKAAGLLTEQ